MSCQSKPQESKQTLRLNLFEDVDSFDPREVRLLKDLSLVSHLYEGLTRLDQHHQPQLALAEELQVEGLTYTFSLREAYWTDGKRIDAYDFVETWTHPLESSPYAYMLDLIDHVQALDDFTLQVQLKKPTPYFLELTAFPIFFPIHGDATCGPFSLEKWVPNQEVVLKKNPTYWDKEHVYLDTIHFSQIADNHTESLLFEKGELDWLGQPLSRNIPTDLLPLLEQKESCPIAGTFFFVLNSEKEPFNNLNIRKAFAMALSRKKIVQHILQGNQEIATTLVPPAMGLLSTSPFVEDPKEAKKLFEEGIKELKRLPSIELTYPFSERNHKIVQAVQQMWQEVFEIPIHLRCLEHKVYLAQQKQGQFQMSTSEWVADYPDPNSFLERFNAHEYEDSRQAEEALLQTHCIIPLYHYAFDYVKKEGVSDVILSPLGTCDFKYAKKRLCCKSTRED